MEVAGRKTLECDCCREDGISNDAVEGFCEDCNHFLCIDCYKIHRRPKPWRNHILLEKAEMPKARPEKIEEDECFDVCSKHPKKVTEYFCKDHAQIGCSDCIIFAHKSCEVDYITNVSRSFEKSQEFGSFKGTIHELKLKVNEKKQKWQHAQDSLKRAYEDIKALGVDLNTLLQIIEIDIADLEKNIETDRKYNEETLKAFNKLEAVVDSFNGDIMEKVEKKLNCQLFLTVKRNIDFSSTVTTSLESINLKLLPYNFYQIGMCTRLLQTHCEKLTKACKSADSFECESHEVQDEPRSKIIYRLVAELNMRSSSDRETCEITSILKLSGENLAVVDKKNHCLKVIDIKANKVVKRRMLSDEPHAMTLAQSKLAITIPQKGTVSIFNINGLKWVKGIQVGLNCFGIVFHENRFFVGFLANPGCIKEINIHGQITNTFFMSTGLHCSLSIHADSKTIYSCIANGVDRRAIRMSFIGEILSTHRDETSNFTSIAVSSEGNVLICDKENSEVRVLDSTMQYKLGCLGESHGIKHPECLTYSDIDQTLYVTMDDKVKAFRSFIFNRSVDLDRQCGETTFT